MKVLKNSFKILTAFFLFASCIGHKKSGEESGKVKVSGIVTQTFSYCGGARPSNEMLAKLNEPRPFANKTIFILKGNKNDFDAMNITQVTTDSSGNFTVSLEPGEYCIVDDFKHSKSKMDEILKKYEKETTNYSAVDPECLKNWFATPDLVFTVAQSGMKDIPVVYHHPCSWHTIPCVNYKGPLPP